jgi:hypothetical protein
MPAHHSWDWTTGSDGHHLSVISTDCDAELPIPPPQFPIDRVRPDAKCVSEGLTGHFDKRQQAEIDETRFLHGFRNPSPRAGRAAEDMASRVDFLNGVTLIERQDRLFRSNTRYAPQPLLSTRIPQHLLGFCDVSICTGNKSRSRKLR